MSLNKRGKEKLPLLTRFVCQNTIHPYRLDHVKFGAELGRKQGIADVKEPSTKQMSEDE